MTAATYKEPQHPRGPNGQWKSKGWSAASPGMSGRAKVAAGGVGVAVSGFAMVESAFGLVTAVLTAVTVLVGVGTTRVVSKKRKRRRSGTAKKATPMKTTGTRVTRFGTVRLGDEKAIRAFAELQRQRQERRDEVWGRRKAAAAAGVRRVTGKKESAFAQWPAATVTPDPSLSPEDKFKTLRNSGYKGWIDQDGNAVADVDEWVAKQKAAAE